METESQSNNISVASVAPLSDDKVANVAEEEACPKESNTLEEKLKQDTDNNAHDPLDEDELEEGELKDDDDDDDDDELATNSAKVGESKSNKTSTKSDSDDESQPTKPSTSTSSSSESSRPASAAGDAEEEPKPPPSSKSSSRNGSHYGSYSKTSSSYGHESRIKSRHSLIDKYRKGREREDPSEKAAKLISMRTKLLEARSREIEMKFQKNKIRLSPPPSSRLSLDEPKNVKMTLTLPSISYSENPNPPLIVATTNGEVELAKKTKSKQDEGERSKSKKSKKKKKKKSKKHKKAKSSSSSKKISTDNKATVSLKTETESYDNSNHLGPKTPPDNHVLTMNDEQVEWPSHLIKMTTTLPSISYSVNPDSVNSNMTDDDREAALLKRRRSTVSSMTDNKRFKADDKSASFSSSPSQKTVSPISHRMEDATSYRKYQSKKTYDLDLNYDYSWYYNYFINSFEMDANQAQQQALSAVVSGSYNPEVLEKWLNGKGLSKISPKDPDIKRQLYPFVTKEPFSFIPDASGNTDVTLEGSVRTIVTRVSRNTVNKDADNPRNQQEEQANSDSIVKQETNTDKPDLSNFVNAETEIENFPKTEHDEKACETSEVKEEKSNQESCIVPVRDMDRCITLRPVQPQITIVKSQKEVILPNGQTLPAGTIQRIVHPYPRVDTEMLGPCFDLY